MKKFLERKKREENIKYKKIIENKRNTILYNKKRINDNLNLPPPIIQNI